MPLTLLPFVDLLFLTSYGKSSKSQISLQITENKFDLILSSTIDLIFQNLNSSSQLKKLFSFLFHFYLINFR